MARTDTLANFVTDVANAIRTKSGKSELISPSNFDNEIINLPSGGTTGGAEPNIFIQEEEPTIKEGLWIKTSDIQVDHTVVDENVFVAEEWMDTTLIGKIDESTNTQAMSCAIVGNYLYANGKSTSSATPMYRINLTDYTNESLGTPTVAIAGKVPIVVGTDIYYVGNNTSSVTTQRKYTVKYDTINNTYTKLADCLYEPGAYAKPVYYNGYIYMFNANATAATSADNGYQPRRTLKYDIANDTWTQLVDYPNWYIGYSDPIVIGDRVWFFFHYLGSSYNSNISNFSSGYRKTIVFNLTTEQYENTNVVFADSYNSNSVSDSPRVFVHDDICYIMVRSGYIYKVPVSEFVISEKTKTITLTDYKYITFNDLLNSNKSKYTRYRFITQAENKVYISGFTSASAGDVAVLALTSKEFDNNTLIIRQGNSNGGAVLTQLFNMPLQKGRLTYPLYNAIHYTTENGANNSLPLYYGTGTEWVKFKN